MKKYNQFYTHLQSHSRGEITVEELQNEADKLFLSGKWRALGRHLRKDGLLSAHQPLILTAARSQTSRGHILAEIRIFDGESIESALRRFKRQVQQEGIIKEVKRHSFFLKPGEKKRLKSKLAQKLKRKKVRRQPPDSDSKGSPRSQ
jgi:small subunit ribosomal protein S21